MKTKKLQLLTVLLFILTILLMIIGLILIDFYNYHHFGEYWYIKNNPNITDWKINGYIIEDNGFLFWKENGIKYILTHHSINTLNYNYHINNIQKLSQSLLQLQIGVIFCVILLPILAIITLSLIFLIIALKIKSKNTNFWDFIENCELINNSYIH